MVTKPFVCFVCISVLVCSLFWVCMCYPSRVLLFLPIFVELARTGPKNNFSFLFVFVWDWVLILSFNNSHTQNTTPCALFFLCSLLFSLSLSLLLVSLPLNRIILHCEFVIRLHSPIYVSRSLLTPIFIFICNASVRSICPTFNHIHFVTLLHACVCLKNSCHYYYWNIVFFWLLYRGGKRIRLL